MFDPTKYDWIQVGPGQWTVRSKNVSPGKPAGYLGPSAKDLMGGNITFSMGGEEEGIEFTPADISPRDDPPTYAG